MVESVSCNFNPALQEHVDTALLAQIFARRSARTKAIGRKLVPRRWRDKLELTKLVTGIGFEVNGGETGA